MFKLIQLLFCLAMLTGLIVGIQADNLLATKIFQSLLVLTLIFSLLVWPFVNAQAQEIPEEDFQRDVRKGL